MADYDKLLELSKMANSHHNNNDNVKNILLFLGGIAVGFGIKMALDSETFKNATKNAQVVMRNYLDNTVEYQEPADDMVEVYIMDKNDEK